MGIRLQPKEWQTVWDEPDDAIRIHFDAWPLLERAGIRVEQADQDPHGFISLLEEVLDADAEGDLRSPGPHIGPDAGDWVNTFLDAVVTTGGVLAAAEYAGRIARKLRELGTKAYVSKGGIEALSRQQLRFHGHPEDSLIVTIEFIAIPDTSGLTGVPPTLESFAAVFRLGDGRLVTMRWTLDGMLLGYNPASVTTAGLGVRTGRLSNLHAAMGRPELASSRMRPGRAVLPACVVREGRVGFEPTTRGLKVPCSNR